MKKLIIAGGTGFLGNSLINYFKDKFDEIIILSRHSQPNKNKVKYIVWDAENLGEWKNEFENADVVINLCGKSVDCRYTEKNKALIFSSRLNSTSIIGKAIQQTKNPPALWINAASATIYKHSEDQPNTEADGEYGSGFSVEVCKAWEKCFNEISTPGTRKINLRITMVMGKGGGVFPVLTNLTKKYLGGTMGNGRQFVSWVHETDFSRMIEWFIHNKNTNGNYNCAAPNPIRNKEMMQLFRKQNNVSFGLPAAKWMLEIGAFFMRTETELVLKSRNVIPDRAMKEGFELKFKDMKSCIEDLAK